MKVWYSVFCSEPTCPEGYTLYKHERDGRTCYGRPEGRFIKYMLAFESFYSYGCVLKKV